MRKIIASTFVSLDGVMQAPGGPQEDPVNGFKFGGWVFHYADDTMGAVMGELFAKPFALLLGRRTYDIFAAHWPYQDDDIARPSIPPRNMSRRTGLKPSLGRIRNRWDPTSSQHCARSNRRTGRTCSSRDRAISSRRCLPTT